MINSLMIALLNFRGFRTIHPAMQSPCVENGFNDTMEFVYFLIYFAEFIIKCIARPRGYWKGFNLFDFALLLFSMIDLYAMPMLLWIDQTFYGGVPPPEPNMFECLTKYEMQWMGTSNWLNEHYPTDKDIGDPGADDGQGAFATMKMFRFFKVFRAHRALRAIRTIRFIRSLSVLMQAILSTLSNYLVSIAVVVFGLILILGVIGNNLFSSEMPIGVTYLGETETTDNWTSLSESVK